MFSEQVMSDWCDGWIAGFGAAARLFSDQYNRYAADRDEYFARRGAADREMLRSSTSAGQLEKGWG